ncbi:hypothetical protein PPYR_14172 [Photinus pyralis]|uniref:Dynein intermediate chain 3, ciliary n=1 Tax=Photinus pyralis TaxID=7054 RepID=A0A5N4A4H0_PHOPY|nr:dynein intermediate chain 3, ciliary-like [Photinus pyralis]KAB0792213.1 hypothetical protein PPYR_14172 [Photinus pyralis]
MDLQFVYQKKRSEFGRQCLFTDKGPDLIDNYPSNIEHLSNFILRDPVTQSTQCGQVQSEHELNTTRAHFVNYGINHSEGGWPKDVNKDDEEQVKRYRRKIEKEDAYNPSVMSLSKSMEHFILQNNSMNIYQQYFTDVKPLPMVEQSSVRTVNVYQDCCEEKRPVNRISWSPDGGTKLAVTHCCLDFQKPISLVTNQSYLWDIENPNTPLLVFTPRTTPMVCVEYHTKDVNTLVSGHLSGRVALWDARRGNVPVNRSVTEVSHREPARSVLWINSKSGLEFFSTSTDGQVKWWDTRKLNQPLETLILSSPGQVIEKAMSACSLEYEPSIPTRFMVGTEKGVIISCNRKGKSPGEKMATKFHAHLGPVLAIQRNSGYVKNFLSVGDWTVRIWSEDCKESSIMWTSYHGAYLSDGCWSPTRVSVYFTTRSDGILDVWDVLQQQKQACLSIKVSDEPLTCLRVHEQGRLLAVGNTKGTTSLVQVSENLATSSRQDKMLLNAMFEREAKREKILEARNREIKLKQKTKSATLVGSESQAHVETSIVADDDFESDPNVQTAEDDFYYVIEAQTKKG